MQFQRSFESEYTDIIAPMYIFADTIARYGEKQDKTEASEDRINRYKYLIFR